jgi:hypothetical protein
MSPNILRGKVNGQLRFKIARRTGSDAGHVEALIRIVKVWVAQKKSGFRHR